MKNLSPFGKISLSEFFRNLLLAVLATLLAGLGLSLNAAVPHFPTAAEWYNILINMAAVAVVFISGRIGTNSNNQLLRQEKK